MTSNAVVPEDQAVVEPNWDLAGEALTAVSGLFPAKPLTPEQGAQAEALGEKVQAAAEKFCRFGKFDTFKMPAAIDFEEVYGDLLPLTEEESAIATEGLVSPDLIEAWEATVNRCRAYLRAEWPIIIRQTPTGPEWVEPSRTVGGKMAAMLAVLERPLRLLEEANRGSLTPSMVAAVSACYPELYDRMLGAFAAALQEAGAKGRRCPRAHESVLRLLFQLPAVGGISFGAQEAPKPPVSKEIDIDFEGLRTKNQSIE